MNGKDILEAGANRFVKWNRIIAAAVIVILAGVAVFQVTRTVSQNDTCNAIETNNEIFKDFVQHQKYKSLQNVEAGITSETTSVKSIEEFYGPTIHAINQVSC